MLPLLPQYLVGTRKNNAILNIKRLRAETTVNAFCIAAKKSFNIHKSLLIHPVCM